MLSAFAAVRAMRPSAAEDRLKVIEAEISAMRQEIMASSSQNAISLSGLITRSDADMRQEVADRITAGMAEVRDRLEAELSRGREDGAKGSAAATEAMMKRMGEFSDRTTLSLASLEKKTTESLETIRERVGEKLGAIGQQVQAKLDENIKEGFAHFEKVQEHLKKAEIQLRDVSVVGASINELNNLLKLPHLRGGFGEAALESLLSEFLPARLYELQAQVAPNSPERVDALIKLPGASLPIDSKFPREQVLALFESSDAASLVEARKALSRTTREQAKDIHAKYIRPDCGTTDMALMFLPSETLYFEVVRDGELWEFLVRHRVYPVSPNTLATTLSGISLSHDYYRMAMGVKDTIEDVKKARKHFRHFHDRFDNVGKHLEKAREAYGVASSHLGRYSGSVFKLTGEPESPDDEPGQDVD